MDIFQIQSLQTESDFPALLFFSQKIPISLVNSTSSAQTSDRSTIDALNKNSNLNRSFEKPRRYSQIYDFVVRRQSNSQNTSSSLFGFDSFKQATDKLTRRKKKNSKKQHKMLITAHKSSTEADDHHLRIPDNVSLCNFIA